MLDQFQNAAAMHAYGPCLALAGPGSGKTTVIVHRICNLIRKYHVLPENIMVVTFTRDAAKEMRERFLNMYKESNAPVTFGTFHGICYQILRQEASFHGMHILTAAEKRVIYDRLFKDIPLAYEDDNYKDYFEQAIGLYRRSPYDENIIERAKSLCGLSLEELRDHYEKYCSQKKKLNAMDFDDLIGHVLERFKEDEEMLKRWKSRYRFFLVDEMQDMDEKQFDLIRMLSRGEDNVFAVGDDDQSIYAFRGAAPKIMLSFKEYYPDAKIIRLERNYRSSVKICDAAQRLIMHNKTRYEKDPRPMSEDTGSIKIIECMDEKEEAKNVCGLLEQKDVKTAVIYRNRSAAAELIKYLEHEGIDYRISGKRTEDDRFGIAGDMASYMNAAKGEVRRADLIRILNRPNRFLGREYIDEDPVDIKKLLSCYDIESDEYKALSNLFINLGIVKNLRPFAAMNFIRKGMGYDKYLTEEEEKRHLNMGTMINEADRITDQMRFAEDTDKALSILNSKSDEKSGKITTEKESPELMTFHASKGLEYERVIMIECNDGTTPSGKAQTLEAIEEERRLFYVALTRAKKEAILFTTRRNANKITYPSRFISEIA